MKKELNEINFNDLLVLDSSVDVAKYDFEEYLRLGHHPVKGYCLRCENKGINICPQDSSFQLKNISHGSTTSDFIKAIKNSSIDYSDWHEEGVMFLMESPSKDYDIYEEVSYSGFTKRPTKLWYWIHREQKPLTYPEKFKGGEYGALFNSIVFTFKLKNAYLTNLVKCGLNDENDQYKGIGHYDPECVKTCYESFLLREIGIVKPKVIFCFGSKVYDFLWRQFEEDDFPWVVISLPHPARGQSGFSHELFRHAYYSMILEGLFEAGIVSQSEAEKKYGEFLMRAKRNNG